MASVAAPAARRGADRVPESVDVVGLALLAYVPFLLSSPGKVAIDTKQYLYLDPARLLARAPYLWDPHVGFGTVPHQGIGYLFPMGPFYWVMDLIGVPDWVAQRLWMGTISLLAALGARWLFRMLGVRRAGVLAGTLVYMLTPYQLAYSAQLSVLLLAWAALPWLVGLTMRAVTDGGWRDPALFALVAMSVGSVNASALVFVLLGPALWLVLHACRGKREAVDVLHAGARMALLSIGASLWWIVGLRTQGTYGLPVLELTETLRTASSSASPTDVLRGIGNWYFYGKDALGYSIDYASDYLHDGFVVFVSFAIPVLALAAAGFVRWRHRAYFALLVVVGAVLAVGAWPYDDSTPFGALFKVFANDTAAGLALRNTSRVVPLVVLGLAGLLAAGVTALGTPRRELIGMVVVGALAVAVLLPVWRVGYLSQHLERPNDIPSYWDEAAVALQRAGNSTRVLEVPGSNFSAYRWGDTVEPVTPGLMDRPYAAREVLPAGSAPSVNLLEALDHRMQEGTFEPSSLAPYARLTNVGTVVLRSDLEYERFNTPRPRLLWAQLTQPLASGLEAPRAFGSTKPNRPTKRLPMVDNVELRIPSDASDPPAVALFDVKGAVPIVHTAPSEQPVLMAGDGDGIVDAAAAGLLDGNQLVLESAALDDRALAQALRANADLVLTDSNRRRSQHYFSRIRDESGYTERAGQSAPRDDDHFRLEPFPGSTDASRTVVEQRGAQVGATDYVVTADRPAYAFDGDGRTAWRVGTDAVGARLTVHPDRPVRTDHVTLAQLPGLARSIDTVRLHFDGGDTLDATLDASSRTGQGQTVTFPERTIRDLAVEITNVNVPQYDPEPRIVGFNRVGLGDVIVRETVRLPMDLARLGARAAGHRLDVVLSRLRYEPGQLQDEELALHRQFVLPDARSFAFSGTARVDPNASDEVLDQVLGTTATGTTFQSSDHLAGDLDARASRAFDHDPSTAWTPNLGPQAGRFVEVSLPESTVVDSVELTFVDDRDHSVPTQFSLLADGMPVRSFTVPASDDESQDGATRTVTIPFDPVVGRDLRLAVDSVAPRFTPVAFHRPKVELPVSIAEVDLAGVPVPAPPAPIATPCREDLVRVNGDRIPVRVVGAVVDARRGLTLQSCVDSLSLDRGSNTVDSGTGLDTGLDIDRVVLSSGTSGTAEAATVLGAPLSDAGASVRVVDSGPDAYDLRVRTDGRPFWLVLGESANPGWEANASGGKVGARQVVNGFANGWLVTPRQAGTLTMTLRWTPQRAVWVGIAVSIVAVLVCIALIALGWRRRRTPDEPLLSDEPSQWSLFAFPGAPLSRNQEIGFAVAAAIVTALFSRPWIGIAVGVAVFAAARFSRGRIVLTAGAPVALALARMTRFDDLAWLALALLAVDVVTWWLRTRATPPTQPASANDPIGVSADAGSSG